MNEEMPLAKNPYRIKSPHKRECHAFAEGREAQRQLAIEQGWRLVPSVEWLEQQLDNIEQMETGHWRLVAQALHEAMSKEGK